MKKTLKTTNELYNQSLSKNNQNRAIPANSHFIDYCKELDEKNSKYETLEYIHNAIKEVPSIEYDDLDILMPDDFETFGVRVSSSQSDIE